MVEQATPADAQTEQPAASEPAPTPEATHQIVSNVRVKVVNRIAEKMRVAFGNQAQRIAELEAITEWQNDKINELIKQNAQLRAAAKQPAA
jgi:hypothetical protein